MRIVIVLTFAPPLVGGRQRDAALLASGLCSAGNEASIVAQFASSRFPLRQRFTRRETERTFRYDATSVSIVKPSWPMRISGPMVYAMLWLPLLHGAAATILEHAFRRSLYSCIQNADIVHYLGTGTEPLGFAAMDAARACGAATVIQPAIHPGQWGDRGLDARLYRNADAVLAFTSGEASLIRQLGVPTERVHIVPGSVDAPPETDPKGFRRKHGIQGPLVLFLGRKTEEKGVIRLLEAWASVQPAFPSAKLVIMGPGKMPNTEKRIRGVIDIADASEEQKHDALAACDLLCLPSAGESFGIAVFEALAHGKPVVVGDVPAFRESVEETGCGILVSLEPSDIAKAISTLIREPSKRQEMGARALSLASKHTNEHALRCYLDIYGSISHRPHAHRSV